MRTIKFRAWNPDSGMSEPFCIGETSDPIYWQKTPNSRPLLSTYRPDIDTLMQFTGLKDKSGKEVYEGDIVRAWSQGSCCTFQIYWRQGGSPSWILYPAFQNREMWYLSATEHKPGKRFISVAGEISTTDKDGFYDEGVEVIGNIYENPELIQAEAATVSAGGE